MDRQALELIAARTAHEANRIYCQGLGDFSQPEWANAPDWQKNSAIAGVLAVAANPGITPAEQHEDWLAHKEADGWVYGETKDAEAKTHPCMVPYTDLPKEQQTKDHLFGAIVRSILAGLEQ